MVGFWKLIPTSASHYIWLWGGIVIEEGSMSCVYPFRWLDTFEALCWPSHSLRMPFGHEIVKEFGFILLLTTKLINGRLWLMGTKKNIKIKLRINWESNDGKQLIYLILNLDCGGEVFIVFVVKKIDGFENLVFTTIWRH